MARLKWKKEPGSSVQAPISHGGKTHDYVISHRQGQHTVSFRPPGKHVHVGTFATEREAKAAAATHAGVEAPAKPSVKKTPAQLDREIEASLASAKPPTRRITGELPLPTMKQRAASLSTYELMTAARGLAKKTDAASDTACTAVLDELQRRIPQASFDAFVAEIYA